MRRRRRRSAAWRVGSRVLPALALMAAVAACEASSGAETPRDRTAAAAQPTSTVAAPAPSPTPAAPEPAPTATTPPSNGSDSSDDSRAGSVVGHGPSWSATTCRPYPSYFWMLWRNFLQWNPDGSEILITYGPQLYAVATDGSDTRTVARGETPQGFGSMISFDLSPDGRQLVFAGCDYPRPHFQVRAEPEDYLGYEYELARLGPKIGEPERLTSNHEFDGFPAWSPDGQRVAFLSVLLTDRLSHAGYVGARWLSVMDRGGRGLRIVVQVEAPARSRFRGLALVAPAWSPDGRHVAFAAADADGRVGIYVVPVDGAKQLRLHDLRPLVTDAVSGPAWSPDGQRLVYAKMADDLLGLYAVGADGADEADEAEIVTTAWLLSDRRGIPPPGGGIRPSTRRGVVAGRHAAVVLVRRGDLRGGGGRRVAGPHAGHPIRAGVRAVGLRVDAHRRVGAAVAAVDHGVSARLVRSIQGGGVLGGLVAGRRASRVLSDLGQHHHLGPG
ncbi:MAG: hypothetical protein OXG17_07710 [Chloroflexi bacterium]|nr:hypothetical protein [Chloroflexota bacterium]